MTKKTLSTELFLNEKAVIIFLSFVQFFLLFVVITQYGYFRDELYYIACSDHLAWGYVDHPPLSIAIMAVIRSLLGDSLTAIRLPVSIASALIVFLTGLMVRSMGGKRFAQVLACLAVMAAPVLQGVGRFFSMNAFDILFWALAFYILILIFKNDNRKLWFLFGVVAGLGLLNKYSMGFLGIGLLVGLILTKERKYFADKWLWIGGAAALLLFLPHITWEYVHGFPSLEFMRNASEHKNLPVTPIQFLLGQFLAGNYVNIPIWLAGLYFFFFHTDGKKYRVFGWMTAVIFLIFVMNNSKLYYFSPLFPVLLAGGAIMTEKIFEAIRWKWLKPVYISIVIIGGLVILPFVVPVLPVEKFVKYQDFLGIKPPQEEHSTVGILPQYYADQFGWEEMAELFAKIYHSLPVDDRSDCLIFTRNYGEAAAIDFFGKKYNLPKATCGHNSYWMWGPPKWNGRAAIIIGNSRDIQKSIEEEKKHFNEVILAGVTKSVYAMPYENNRAVLVCRGAKFQLKDIWNDERHYE